MKIPGQDGTGPKGRGSRTGRDLGPCDKTAPLPPTDIPGQGLGRGLGWGLGRGRGLRRRGPP